MSNTHTYLALVWYFTVVIMSDPVAPQKQDMLRAVAQDADLGCFIFMLTPLRAIVTHNQKGLTNRKPAI